MLWIIPAWVASLIAIYFLGYYFRSLTQKVEKLEKVIQSKVDKQPEPEEPKSELLDPDDEVAQAKWAHEDMMRKLNGK